MRLFLMGILSRLIMRLAPPKSPEYAHAHLLGSNRGYGLLILVPQLPARIISSGAIRLTGGIFLTDKTFRLTLTPATRELLLFLCETPPPECSSSKSEASTS